LKPRDRSTMIKQTYGTQSIMISKFSLEAVQEIIN